MTFFSLLPNARTQLSAIAGQPAAGSSRPRLTFGVEIRANGTPVAGEPRVNVGADLYSAGDVIGIDARMIARVDPPSGATGFEPNYMPFVEFVDADFPWRYSFDASGTRVKPWIVLLALKPGEFEFLDQGNAPSPRIRIKDPAGSLPDLSQSWAFAHVHVAHGETLSTNLAQLIATRPDLHLARLLCLRHLEPNTPYTLVLTAATEAGRLAGLGRNDAVEPFNKPAWGATTASGLELPVYYQTRFVTSVLEDFELLARRLQPLPAGDTSLAAPEVAFAGEPGFYSDYSNPDATFEIQDALMRTDHSVQPFNTDPDLTTLLKPTLEAVIAGDEVAPGDDGPDKEDPLVAMPAYGWRFRRQKTVDVAAAQQGAVVDRVNLDLKFRHVAGLGAETVRRNQEHFSRICWSQYRDVVAANQSLTRLKTAREVTSVIARRNVVPLPSDVVASLSETVHDLVTMPNGVTSSQLLGGAGVPRSFTSRALRRVATKRAQRKAATPGAVTPMPHVPGAGKEQEEPVTLRKSAFQLKPELGREISEIFGSETLLQGTVRFARGVAVNPIDLEPIADAITDMFLRFPRRKARNILEGLDETETTKLDPILRAPVISDPLVEQLRVFESRAILRGLSSLPNNTVALLKENRAFVEAFLLGANHEMNNELRWREFPTDMRGTIFRRFWDRKRAPSDPTGDDIPQIHGWTKPLGANYPTHDVDRSEALVLLVRGDIIRKYGTILVVLNRANSTTFVRGQGVDHSPIFAGQLGADACYFGFDVARQTVLADISRYFFVLFEAPGRVRFGLDVASAAVRRERFDYRTATVQFPLRTLDRDPSAPLLPAHLKTGNPPPATAARWDDLSWAHMQLDPSGYLNVETSAPGVTEAPNYWSSDRDSASIARSFWQKPIAAVMPAARILA